MDKLYIGVDSWNEPTQEAINQLKKIDGFKFWAGYVGGADVYNNQSWTSAAWELLKANEIDPLPIWVPKQDCSEDPKEQAQEAIAACKAAGVFGVVAVDSEHSMSAITNHQWWLDSFAAEVHSEGWLSVTYAGGEYVATNSFAWLVKWGDNAEVPGSGEAFQTGPYTLRDDSGNAIMSVDGDNADEHFPFATYTEGESNVTDTTPNAPADSQSVEDATNKITLHAPIVASAMLPDKSGAVMVGADGGVFTRGNAAFHGSIPKNFPGTVLHEPVVAIELVDNDGYTLVAADGGRFPFGNHPNFGAL